MARPTKALAKTMADLPEGWQDTLIENGKLGRSIPGLYTKIGVTKRIHDRFMETEEEYQDYFSYACDLSLSYWADDMGEKLATDRNLNSSIYALQMRNRFKWTQQDSKPTPEKPEKEEPADDLITKHKKPKPEEKQLTTN